MIAVASLVPRSKAALGVARRRLRTSSPWWGSALPCLIAVALLAGFVGFVMASYDHYWGDNWRRLDKLRYETRFAAMLERASHVAAPGEVGRMGWRADPDGSHAQVFVTHGGSVDAGPSAAPAFPANGATWRAFATADGTFAVRVDRYSGVECSAIRRNVSAYTRARIETVAPDGRAGLDDRPVDVTRLAWKPFDPADESCAAGTMPVADVLIRFRPAQ